MTETKEITLIEQTNYINFLVFLHKKLIKVSKPERTNLMGSYYVSIEGDEIRITTLPVIYRMNRVNGLIFEPINSYKARLTAECISLIKELITELGYTNDVVVFNRY